jgi:hypothetical protein
MSVSPLSSSGHPALLRERNPGIPLRRVKRPHRHVLSSVLHHLFPLTDLLSELIPVTLDPGNN